MGVLYSDGRVRCDNWHRPDWQVWKAIEEMFALKLEEDYLEAKWANEELKNEARRGADNKQKILVLAAYAASDS